MTMKNTRQRKAILDYLEHATEPLTAEDIFRAVSQKGLNLSTVYRSLLAFEKEGLVRKDISSQDSKAYFALTEKAHYHILECLDCHRRIRLDYCPFGDVTKAIEKDYGFAIEDENSIIYGLCHDCSEKRKAERKASDTKPKVTE
jgi:Fe2+ or Zn2+ uptake regulation protein